MAIVDFYVRVIEDRNNVSLHKCAIVNAIEGASPWNHFDYREMVSAPKYFRPNILKHCDIRKEYVSLMKGVKKFVEKYIEDGNEITHNMQITVYVKNMENIKETQMKDYTFTEQEPKVLIHTAYIYNLDYRLSKKAMLFTYFNTNEGVLENKVLYIHPSEIPTNLQLDSTYQMSIDCDDNFSEEIRDFVYDYFPKDYYATGDCFRLDSIDAINQGIQHGSL